MKCLNCGEELEIDGLTHTADCACGVLYSAADLHIMEKMEDHLDAHKRHGSYGISEQTPPPDDVVEHFGEMDFRETELVCPECGERVFEHFHRADDSRAKSYSYKHYWCKNGCELGCVNCARTDTHGECTTEGCHSISKWLPIDRGANAPLGGSITNLVEMVAEGCFDQPCIYGNRVEGHAVYCHNSGWKDRPRKCRRTWYTGGDVKDEDCEGFEPNPLYGKTVVEKKCDPASFSLVRAGRKNADACLNDFGIKVGDILRLREYDRASGSYSGRELCKEVCRLCEIDIAGFHALEEIRDRGLLLLEFESEGDFLIQAFRRGLERAKDEIIDLERSGADWKSLYLGLLKKMDSLRDRDIAAWREEEDE